MGRCPSFLTRLNAQQAATFQPVGLMFCPPSRSGNMPVGQARPRRTRGGRSIASSNANYNWDGGANDGNDFNKPAMWGNMRPTPGAFLICMEMCGSGPQTGTGGLSQRQPRLIPRVRHRAPLVSIGAAPGHAGTYLRSATRTRTPQHPHSHIGFRVGFQPVQPDTANPELECSGEQV